MLGLATVTPGDHADLLDLRVGQPLLNLAGVEDDHAVDFRRCLEIVGGHRSKDTSARHISAIAIGADGQAMGREHNGRHKRQIPGGQQLGFGGVADVDGRVLLDCAAIAVIPGQAVRREVAFVALQVVACWQRRSVAVACCSDRHTRQQLRCPAIARQVIQIELGPTLAVGRLGRA